VLEGTSVGLGQGALDGTPPAETEPRRATTPLATEPRPEIWFKRRVRLTTAVRELWAFRELIVTLAERDIRVRYKQAALGIAWALITPLVMMIAFTVIFSKVAHVNTHMPGVPYALFSYMGLLPWTFFATALSGGGMSLVSNTALLNKLYCPREVFPIAAMIDAAVDAFISALVLVVLFPIEGFAPKLASLYLPLLMIPLFMFTLGVLLGVSAVLVYMRDLRMVLPLAIQMGLFVTPVIYSPKSISSHEGVLVLYSVLNPLVPVLNGMRQTVLQGVAPNWLSLGAGSLTSLLVLVGGFVLFKRLETGIADVA
jgi:ABC-2 type transport system permease protein/lipopolysaccharide transport system permease protein